MFGNILSALFLTLIGAALLFNGYRWFRILLPIWAFLVGYGIIAGLMSAAFGHGFFSTALTIVPGIVAVITTGKRCEETTAPSMLWTCRTSTSCVT